MSSTVVHLKDVASFIRGITFKPDDVVPLSSASAVACLRTRNVQQELDTDDVWGIPDRFVKRTEQFLETGDILVSSANSWNLVGKCCRIPDLPWRTTFGGFVSAIRPEKSLVDPRYLYRWFSSPRTQMLVRSYGRQTTNISNLDIERCLRMKLPLPPLDEQRRIAEILDKADALRAIRRAALAQLDSLTQSIFLDMFGDPVSNPKDWPIESFASVCDARLGKMLDAKQQTGEHKRPYLRNANVQWFRFDLTSMFEMDFDDDDREKFELRPGDLLICEGGEPGRAAVWQGQIAECFFQKALHRARPKNGVAVSDYIAWLLWFLAARKRLAGVTSATIAHLTGEKLAILPVMLPPIALQQEFVRRVERVTTLRSRLESSMGGLDAMFGALQYRAFRGEL